MRKAAFLLVGAAAFVAVPLAAKAQYMGAAPQSAPPGYADEGPDEGPPGAAYSDEGPYADEGPAGEMESADEGPAGAPAVGPNPGTGLSTGDISPAFFAYLSSVDVPSQEVEGNVNVGRRLPRGRVTLYRIPPEFGSGRLVFAVVNNRALLVDPRNRRVVGIIG